MKCLTLRDFRELGLLQEINRQILHPCGLALAVAVDEQDPDAGDATTLSVRILDARDDPEGFVFQDLTGIEHLRRRLKVEDLQFAKRDRRRELYGWDDGVQPIGSDLSKVVPEERVDASEPEDCEES